MQTTKGFMSKLVWIYPAGSLKTCKQENYISTQKFCIHHMPIPKSKQAFCDYYFISIFFVCCLFLSQKVTVAEIFRLVKNDFQCQWVLQFEDAFVNSD